MATGSIASNNRPTTRRIGRMNVAELDELHGLAVLPRAGMASTGETRGSSSMEMMDLTAKAAVQVSALRRLLGEAARLDDAVAAKSTDLAQRLDQGIRLNGEMDRRLAAVKDASAACTQAAATIAALQSLVGRVESVQRSSEDRFFAQLKEAEARVESQRLEFEQRTAEHAAKLRQQQERFENDLEQVQKIHREQLAAAQAGFASLIEEHVRQHQVRLEQQREAIDARIAALTETAHRAMETSAAAATMAQGHVDGAIAKVEEAVRDRCQQLSADLDRQAAQTQARAALVLDEAAERTKKLEETAARVAVVGAERLSKTCDRAAAVLGFDPREVWIGVNPVAIPLHGSLADITQRAELAVKNSDEAILRLSAMTDRAMGVRGEVEEAVKSVEGTKDLHVEETQRLFAQIEQTKEAEQRLTMLSERFETLASGVESRIAVAQHADSQLNVVIAQAQSRVQSLDTAMDQATQQASNLVSVAKDVASIVVQAEQARAALVPLVDRAAAKGRQGGTVKLIDAEDDLPEQEDVAA